MMINYYVDKSEKWGGSDFMKTLKFDEENMELLLGSENGKKAENELLLKEYVDRILGCNICVEDLEHICEEKKVHYDWVMYVDRPDVYFSNGRA